MNWKKLIITIFRTAIGWHFLYEGVAKLLDRNWSAAGYLSSSTGPLSGLYQWMSGSESIMNVVDPLNMAALILVGLGLTLGLAIRVSAASGVVLLLLYYFAHPPFGGSLLANTEGSLYIVNKNVIEALALLVLLVLKEKGWGLYALPIFSKRKEAAETSTSVESRREALKNLATIPALGVLGLGAFNETQKFGIDTLSGATIKVGGADIKDLKGELPKGKIGPHEISRLVAGGNLIGGWAHSRDLHYVPSLFRAYNTEKKIFETLMLAEEAGINTINIGFPTNATMQKYKKLTGSKIKVITQVHPDAENNDWVVNINKAIDFGVDIIQIQGNWCDWLVRDNKLDKIDLMLNHIREQGYTAGLASHTVDSLIACEEQGIIPDYYMKTMHHDNYWSAHPRENRFPFEVDGKKYADHNRFHDNLFCLYPDKTVEFVNRATVPVMGFKVLAAGAIQPEDGFNWAFKNGADFICVGMFDFQVVNDVNITIDTLNNLQGRTRKWYG
ncbi:DoxX family membrane protein [Draconibacterium sp. IB214405]|uniref:DoxX family membrane protein n=1 Tax=Draconibacterium sp. IB214405 TaxID=3097352 RepID=UPI002A0CCCE4|nr:DoxX family membrane protein [Draconibacterium sp. IB214405]MDX8337630.1 DoxX family membrane protein [Draconibacterium sp. IB214405]